MVGALFCTSARASISSMTGPGRPTLDRRGCLVAGCRRNRLPEAAGLPARRWFSGFVAVVFFLALVTAVLAIVSAFMRRRGATSVGRAGSSSYLCSPNPFRFGFVMLRPTQ